MKSQLIYPEIMHGANLCAKLKHIFYPKQKWTESISQDVAQKLKIVKKAAKKFYGCDSGLEVCEKLNVFTLSELQEFCQEALNGNKQYT